MLFAQWDRFLRNLDAEVGTYLLFAHCGCRKWSALTITSNAVTITTTFIHHNCHHQHIEGFLTRNVFVQELPGKGWLIAQLNLSVFGFSFVFHDKAKRTQQGNLLGKGGAAVCRKYESSLIWLIHLSFEALCLLRRRLPLSSIELLIVPWFTTINQLQSIFQHYQPNTSLAV